MYLDNTSRETFRNYSAYRQYKYISVIYPPLLLLIGSFGNMMVLIVLYRHTKHISTYVYLLSLACADQTVLVISLTPTWLDNMFGFNPITWSWMSCKSLTFVGNTSSHFAVWLIVAVTVERMIVVSMPLKAVAHTTATRAKYCVLLMLAFFCLVNSHVFHTTGLLTLMPSNQTSSNSAHSVQAPLCDFKREVFGLVWSWFDAAIYCYIPCLIIYVANMKIIHYLKKARQQRQLMQLCHVPSQSTSNSKTVTSEHRYSPANSQSVQQLVMLILVSWVFMLTIIPVVIFKIVLTIIKKQTPTILVDPGFNSKLHLVNSIVELLMNTNHSINFFIYCIAGRKFRKDFMKLFDCSETDTVNDDKYRTSRSHLATGAVRLNLARNRGTIHHHTVGECSIQNTQPELNIHNSNGDSSLIQISNTATTIDYHSQQPCCTYIDSQN